MFLHSNIHKYTWTSPEEKKHDHIDYVLIDEGWCSSIVHVQSF
jgi:hypothetical protein